MNACGICGMSDLHRTEDQVTNVRARCNSCDAYFSDEEGCWVADCESCGKMTADVRREADCNYCPECYREATQEICNGGEGEPTALKALKAGIRCLEYFVTNYPHLQSDDVDTNALVLMRQAVAKLEASDGS